MMIRLVVLLGTLSMMTLRAQDDAAPPISITSPDTARTFSYGTVKNHALIWSEKEKLLSAEVTFTDARQDQSPQQPQEDTVRFRLPGVTFDAARGLFLARTSTGQVIPVARRKKTLFFTTIEVLPNATVRILHPHGAASVVLEATNVAAPATSAPSSPDGTHTVDLHSVL